METINDFWSMNEGTFACLHDSKRTTAFKRAIKKSIKKGDVVVEMGAGSGILSMFAADAGASRVYAVELDQGNINSLKKAITENGYSDKIIIIEGDATKIDLPEKVDFIICEMITTGLIEELQVPAMNNALRFAKSNTRVLIEEYEIFIELVSSKATFYNKKFNIIRFELPEMRDMRSIPFSEKILFKKIVFSKINKKTTISEKVKLPVTNTGFINALRITGKTYFSDGSTFESSTSYDFPLILPIDSISINRGSSILAKLSYKLCAGPNTLKYTIC